MEKALPKRIVNTPRIIITASASFLLNASLCTIELIIAIADKSLWFLALFFFYLILALMKFSAVSRNMKTDNSDKEIKVTFISTGILLILLDIALSFVTAITLAQKHIQKHSEIVMIAIATYVFLKITMIVIRDFVKDKYAAYPAITAIKAINWTETAVSVFTMQRSMLVTFSSENGSTAELLMNIITSTAVSMLIVALGILMIRKGIRHEKNPS